MIVRTIDNAAMGSPGLMQMSKVNAVLSQQDPTKCQRLGENNLIDDALTRLTCLTACQHIVPQCPQRLDDRVAKVLIGVKVGQESSHLVPMDLRGDLRPMLLRVIPGVN